MIKIIPLGVNGAFTKYYHNNYVFELGDRKLLVDAGTTLRNSLPDAGFKETDITDIIITHLHSDHVGGLEEFAQRCKWMFNHKPNLWIRSGMKGQFEEVVGKGLYTDGLTLNDYFNVFTVETGYDYSFNIGEFYIELVNTDNLHAQGMKSMGLRVNDPNGQNIIFTSDIAKHEESCFKGLIDNRTVALFHDVSIVPNAVHSHLDDVIEYYKDAIEVYRIYAMHYQDDVNTKELEEKYGINFAVRNETYII
jgi:glyoxylase-like metal-dependent hydrolase (beta-lactamase superfamily II)